MRKVSSNSVLLVDDDPTIRNFLSSQLEKAGFKAQQAEDGIDGLVKLRNGLPQVIISDLQMPRMSGLEFVSVVRRRFPSIPVIVLSGSIQRELPEEVKPDRWFRKYAQQVPELLRAVHDLARKTPDQAYLPQVISTPVRTRPDGDGYFVLTCTDCLRLFQVTSTPENKAVEGTAVCTYCEARVPFVIESSAPDKGGGRPVPDTLTRVAKQVRLLISRVA
jgi:CheY-like chemotaxis protein